jgi:hypothetical protein
VAKLVDNNHHADQNDECDGRNQKFMHRCTVFSLGKARSVCPGAE